MQRAIHSRFFRRIYRRPKQRDVLSSVIICVYCIYFTICVSAFKHLVGSFSNVIASATRLTCIGRWNYNTFHTVKQRLVLNILPKQREIPFTKFRPRFQNPKPTAPYASQIFPLQLRNTPGRFHTNPNQNPCHDTQ